MKRRSVKRGGSSTSYVMKTVGDLSSQVSKALSTSSKTNTLAGGSRKRKAGSHCSKTKRKVKKSKATRKRKGGFLGSVLSSAIVPFGLWGASRTLARRIKKKKGKK